MKKVSIIFLLLSVNFAFCQEKKSETSTVKVYQYGDETDEVNTYKWVFKTDFYKIIGGEIPLIFEYRVSEKISIEGSAGVTYNIWGNGNLFEDDLLFDDASTTPAFGSAFRFGGKFYPSSDWDAIEGWAFGFQAFYKTNNSSYESNSNRGLYRDEANITDENSLDAKRRIGVLLTISKQMFWDSNIGYEPIIGIGFTNVNRKYQEYSYDSSTYNHVEDNKVKPIISLGLRLGFGN